MVCVDPRTRNDPAIELQVAKSIPAFHLFQSNRAAGERCSLAQEFSMEHLVPTNHRR